MMLFVDYILFKSRLWTGFQRFPNTLRAKFHETRPKGWPNARDFAEFPSRYFSDFVSMKLFMKNTFPRS